MRMEHEQSISYPRRRLPRVASIDCRGQHYRRTGLQTQCHCLVEVCGRLSRRISLWKTDTALPILSVTSAVASPPFDM